MACDEHAGDEMTAGPYAQDVANAPLIRAWLAAKAAVGQ